MSEKYVIRQGLNGKLLILGCQAGKGKLALGRKTCFKRWHVAILTDNFQHPGCIDFTSDRGYETTEFDPSVYSQCYCMNPGVGTFHLRLRWQSGHSPYPEIENMEAWAFGKYLGNRSYPKSPDDYITIATVQVKETGQVLVNGSNCGKWPDML